MVQKGNVKCFIASLKGEYTKVFAVTNRFFFQSGRSKYQNPVYALGSKKLKG